MGRLEKKIEQTMQRGGVGFWILCIVFSLGFYGILWFIMALGSAAGY
jgi:hypothetical protein